MVVSALHGDVAQHSAQAWSSISRLGGEQKRRKERTRLKEAISSINSSCCPVLLSYLVVTGRFQIAESVSKKEKTKNGEGEEDLFIFRDAINLKWSFRGLSRRTPWP
jgi:hypothetical protein